MYFGLGFLVSGLLSLLFLPAFWRRAVRLSKRRVEMQMPLSMTEIVAERDQLRAEHALEQRRIEQKYAAVTQARAEDLGELGRRATQIVALGESGSQLRRDLSETGAKLEATNAGLAQTGALAASLHKEVYDKTGAYQAAEDKLRALEGEHSGLNLLAERQRGAIAGLETRVAGLDLRLAGSAREAQELSKALNAKMIEAQVLADERELARAQAKGLTARRDTLQAEVQRQTETIARLEQALAEAEHLIKAAQAETAKQAALIAARDKLLTNAQNRELALQARHEKALEAARAGERLAAGKFETARSEKAIVEGALQAARDERSKLAGELAARALAAPRAARPLAAKPGTSAVQGDELLRQSIKALAGQLMQAAGAGSAPETAQPDSLRRPAKKAKTAPGARAAAEI